MFSAILLDPNPENHKKYRLVPFFERLGFFPNTLGRRQFIFALLDNCSFERTCPKCGGLYMDVLQHTLKECTKAAHLRLILKYKLNFYNLPASVDITNKYQLFLLAVEGKRVFRTILCEYLIDIGMYI